MGLTKHNISRRSRRRYKRIIISHRMSGACHRFFEACQVTVTDPNSTTGRKPTPAVTDPYPHSSCC